MSRDLGFGDDYNYEETILEIDRKKHENLAKMEAFRRRKEQQTAKKAKGKDLKENRPNNCEVKGKITNEGKASKVNPKAKSEKVHLPGKEWRNKLGQSMASNIR